MKRTNKLKIKTVKKDKWSNKNGKRKVRGKVQGDE